jgi:hypothetical protein
MSAVVFEHVKVAELPEAWRSKLAKHDDARVTVRIEDEVAYDSTVTPPPAQPSADPAFGIWRDREDMTDIEAYLRKLRAPRYSRDGTRNDG